jgi:N-methylhydantoinase A
MQAFEKSYVTAFTRTPPTSLVELINIRVSASVETSDRAPLMPPAGSGTTSAVKGTRAVYFPEFGDYRPATVFDRYALASGQFFDGPAIVEERESTLVVGPGGRFEVHDSGAIVVSID